MRYGGVGREAQILDVLQSVQPDVTLLVEVTDTAVVATFASAMQMQSFIAPGNGFSIALLSRWSIVEASSTRPFPPIRDTILDAVVEYQPGRRLYLIGVHPIAFPGTFFECWRRWEVSLALKRAAAHQNQPCIIAGDFNAIAPGDRVLKDGAPREMRLLYGLQRGYIYRTVMERIAKAGFTDCFRRLHPGEDGFTIPTPQPKVRLDYICANPLAAEGLRRCEVIRQPEAVDQASDHYPLLAEFDLE
ncbi:MAG TPA: endonuclease/exonuclease/phosphatase family protein [Phototrophicaceae bacterium]|nr:endonuclease/exonuclease/phosphatase family protein [Phototrophicaceae bacterium]